MPAARASAHERRIAERGIKARDIHCYPKKPQLGHPRGVYNIQDSETFIRRRALRNVTPITPVDDKTNGKALKAAMARKHETNQSLSDKTGLSTRTICNLRSGARGGTFASWLAISRALGMTVEEVLGFE